MARIKLLKLAQTKANTGQAGSEMSIFHDFTKGFLIVTVIIWILNIGTVAALRDMGIAIVFLLILLTPLSIIALGFLKHQKIEKEKLKGTDRLKQILFSVHGVSFACWAFDVSTTYYVIDVLRVAAEQNPLGWPLGVVGALIFYAPAFVFTYLLLFRFRHRFAVLVAIFVTFLALWVGNMNLIAGFQNFALIVTYPRFFSTEVYCYLLCTIITLDSVCAIVFRKLR